MERPGATKAVPPPDVGPMLATADAVIPRGPWAYEMKWDGVRALALVRGRGVRLTSRNGNDLTVAYPELHALVDELGPQEALLDGEIVALGDGGRASFQLLQRRMHVREPAAVARLATRVPIVYMVFDLLWLDGRSLLDSPYGARRAALEDLGLRGPHWQVPPHGLDGDAAMAASEQLGFEGIVAKRLDARYEPGRRSRAWLKLKHQLRQELVVAGWEPGQGGRTGRPGSLLLGYYDEEGLRYAGKVGTGFTEAELDRLAARLGSLERPTSPFVAGTALPRTAHFAEPALVAEVRFSEWTAGGRIRQASYLGLRGDKAPHEVVREPTGPMDRT